MHVHTTDKYNDVETQQQGAYQFGNDVLKSKS